MVRVTDRARNDLKMRGRKTEIKKKKKERKKGVSHILKATSISHTRKQLHMESKMFRYKLNTTRKCTCSFPLMC